MNLEMDSEPAVSIGSDGVLRLSAQGHAQEPTVVFEDPQLLILYKPAGMLSQGDYSGDEDLLTWGKRYIKEAYQKPGNVFLGLVHRLDRPVEGIMVFARTSKAARRLNEQFRGRMVQKRYHALVSGIPRPSEGVAEDCLRRDHRRTRVEPLDSTHPKAQYAKLRWRVRETYKKGALLDIQLETGRTHQIRVQLSTRGWPIVGDRKYGSRILPFGPNLALQAAHLSVTHPTKGYSIEVSASVPEAWTDAGFRFFR